MEPASEDLEFHDRDGYLEVRALGPYGVEAMKRQLDRAASECLERKTDRLLFDITAVENYRPTTAERLPDRVAHRRAHQDPGTVRLPRDLGTDRSGELHLARRDEPRPTRARLQSADEGDRLGPGKGRPLI
jgi:hypothetical protein